MKSVKKYPGISSSLWSHLACQPISGMQSEEVSLPPCLVQVNSNTGSVALPVTELHTRFCAQSHHSRPGKLQSRQVSKSLRLPELWGAEHQRAPRAKYLMHLLVQQPGQGEQLHMNLYQCCSKIHLNLQSNFLPSGKKGGRREALQAHCQIFPVVLPHCFIWELGTKYNICLNAW